MSLLSVKFLITCQTKLGEVVYICGNTPQLGSWNPQNAMRLYTDSALYPKWDPYRSIFVRQGNKLLFKLCIMNQDKTIRWESIHGNRQIIANESLLVEFTAHFQEITITPINEEVIKAPRKKTCDILNELESDGSSSKQYWKQFMQEEQESVLYITLTTQMRRIAEYQWAPLDQLNCNLHSHQFDKNFSTRIEKTTEISHKTSNFYCIMENAENDELVSVLGQDSYLVRLSEFDSYSIHNNMVPVFFHIETLKASAQNQCCFQVFQNIQRIIHAENILLSEKQRKIEYYVSVRLHWDPSLQLVQLLIKKKVSLILVESTRILQLLLSLLTELNIQYHAQDFTKISISLKNVGVMRIHLLSQTDPKFTFASNLNKRQRSQLENKYFDFIKGQILKNSNKVYVGYSKTNYIESIKQDETFASLIYHRKNVMIINAEKIQDLTSKLMTEIIALSSKPNFQVYIILDKLTLDIKSKFPVSKNNKIVVIGKSGTLYANEQIFVDLFQNLNLQKAKFSEAISKIIFAIQLGLESKQVLASNQTIVEFKKGQVGKIGTQILKTKLKQHNQDSLHKLVLQHKQNGKYSIKPFCLSEQFIVKAIMQNLSKHVYQDRSLILSINLKNSNQFIHKTNTIFNKLFKNKINIKMRFLQIIANNEPDYCYISSQEVASVQILEAKLQFLCEHFLTGSNIKTYNLNMLSPQKGRRSFINKLHAYENSFENF